MACNFCMAYIKQQLNSLRWGNSLAVLSLSSVDPKARNSVRSDLPSGLYINFLFKKPPSRLQFHAHVDYCNLFSFLFFFFFFLFLPVVYRFRQLAVRRRRPTTITLLLLEGLDQFPNTPKHTMKHKHVPHQSISFLEALEIDMPLPFFFFFFFLNLFSKILRTDAADVESKSF